MMIRAKTRHQTFQLLIYKHLGILHTIKIHKHFPHFFSVTLELISIKMQPNLFSPLHHFGTFKCFRRNRKMVDAQRTQKV